MKRLTLITISLVMLLSIGLAACQAQAPSQPTSDSGYPVAGSTAAPVEGGYPVATEVPSVNPSTAYPAGAESSTNTEAPAIAGSTVRVATDATWPPFEIVDENTKELTGFDIDLMNAIAEKAGFTVEWNNLVFDSMLAGLASCQFDAGISAITITDERKQEMLFSDPYMSAGQIVVTRPGSGINSVSDLDGKTVAAQLGTTGEIEAKKIPNVIYKPYDTVDLAFLDLANGQVDAVIADYPTALGFVGKNPEKMVTAGEPFTSESYGIAICKNRSDLVDPINTALQQLKDDGTVKTLEDKWLSNQ